MDQRLTVTDAVALRQGLAIDCKKCSGLCCTALYCTKADGFPADKQAGKPCAHLAADFRCKIHQTLAGQNLRGCMAYDCFGAGQKATARYLAGVNWKSTPEKAQEIFAVFGTLVQLHQMQWYLVEAWSLARDGKLKDAARALILQNEKISSGAPAEILQTDIDAYRLRVNTLLKQAYSSAVHHAQTCGSQDFLGKNFRRANLDGTDLSMALLIAADLRGCSVRGVNLLGADMRDTDVRSTDLSACVYLTQMQVNTAKGNAATKLPAHLTRPDGWKR